MRPTNSTSVELGHGGHLERYLRIQTLDPDLILNPAVKEIGETQDLIKDYIFDVLLDDKVAKSD